MDKESVLHKTSGNYELQIYAGELPKEVQDSLDLVVLSPGVPTDLPIVKGFYEQGLPVWGEVELAYETGKGEVLAITGTNGKTTTTALLGKIMKDARESVFVVGNIGTPYTSKALEMKDNTITVAEISSFQLETISKICSQGKRHSEHYRGSSEPPSYHGRVHPCERADHQQPGPGGCVRTEL